MENSFEAGRIYKSNYGGDVYVNIEITKITAKRVSFKVGKSETVKTSKIHNYDGSDYFFPEGRYSMAPVCKASKIVSK